MSNRLTDGIKAGSTSVSLPVELQNLATGQVQTGLNATDITSAYYLRQGDTPQYISLSQLSSDTATFSAGGWFPYSSSGTPGIYRLDVPDAAFAVGADWVAISVVVNSPECRTANFMLGLKVKDESDLNDIPAGTAMTLTAAYDAAKTAAATGAAMTLTAGERTSIAAAIWNALTSGFATVGSAGKRLVDFLTGDSFTRIGTNGSGLTGVSLDVAQRVKLATAQPDYVPAKAGDAMALTSGERDAVSAVIESHLLNEGDGQMLVNAIVGTIGNTNLDQAAVVAAIRADMERAGGKLQLIDAKTTNLPAVPAAVGSAMALTSAYDAAKTAASATAIANLQAHGDTVWHTATGFAVTGDIPSASAIASAVNTTLTNAHGLGSWQQGTGGGGSGSLTDPWTVSIPGDYEAGTAGEVINQLFAYIRGKRVLTTVGSERRLVFYDRDGTTELFHFVLSPTSGPYTTITPVLP